MSIEILHIPFNVLHAQNDYHCKNEFVILTMQNVILLS